MQGTQYEYVDKLLEGILDQSNFATPFVLVDESGDKGSMHTKVDARNHGTQLHTFIFLKLARTSGI